MVEQTTKSKSRIISLSVDNLSFKDSMGKITDWGFERRSGFICFANVHMIIEAYSDSRLQQDLKKALLVLPDGKPLSFACNWLYHKKQERVSGMDFMPALFEEIAGLQGKIFFFGSTPEVLGRIVERVEKEYPSVTVAGAVSPPFRSLSKEETDNYIQQINDSGANFVMVALGCPKQEKWMAENYQSIQGVMLGLGGAFPVFARVQKRCPTWMRESGFEWFYRLLQEPRRLFRRYCITNVKFLYLFSKQMLFRPDASRALESLN